MEDKQKMPVWQWILLGVLGVILIGVVGRYMILSGKGFPTLSVPGMNRESTQTEEYIPEPTPQPGT